MDKDRPNIIVFPPGAFFAAVLLTLGLARWLSLGLLTGLPRSPALVIGIAVMAVALLINVTGVLAFRRASTNINPYKPALNVVRDGPYRFTRNPMYLGMVVFVAGLGVAISTLWGPILAGLLWAVLHWGVVLREELYLTEKFGDAYSELVSATRRWL
jgi:protein-S-isoprenylcysteine O-methyltransferase Ste14